MGFFSTLVPLLENFSSEVTPVINIVDSGLDEHFLKSLKSFLKDHPKKPILKIRKFPTELVEPFRKQTYYMNRDLFRVSTLSKIALPYIFPDCEFGVYLDCDIYVQKDFAQLLQYQNGKSHFYAVQDRYIKSISHPVENIDSELFGTDPDAPYFNGGFFVMNLKGFDRNAYWDTINRVGSKAVLSWEDQSLMNITLCNKWEPICESWNRMVWPEHAEYSFPKKDINYHFFGGQKPWSFSPALSIGLVPKFYKILKENPIEGFDIPTINRPHSLWWIKNFFVSTFTKLTKRGKQNPS